MPPTVRQDDPATVVFAFLDLNDGGAQRLTLTACQHFDRARYRPVVLNVRGGGALVGHPLTSGLPVVELNRLRQPYDLIAVPAIARQLRRLGATVVHVHLYSRSSPYVRLAARLAQVPLVVAHEWCRPERPRGLRHLSERLLAPSTRFIAASRAQARELIDESIDPSSVEVVYSGIDATEFEPRDKAESRAELGLPPDRAVVLVPARLHPMKGHADLLAAVGQLSKRFPELLVLCAGDGPLRSVLPPLAESAGLGSSVRFLGQRADMPLLYGACDVVALASHIEGLPSVVLEAFAAGRAVVAPAVGGVPEIVLDDETGWLTSPGDPRDLADALADALMHAAVRDQRAERGRQLVLDEFRADTAASRLQDVYDKWLCLPVSPVADASDQRTARGPGKVDR